MRNFGPSAKVIAIAILVGLTWLLLPAQAHAQCEWRPVDRAGRIGLNSHQPGPPWCAPGEFLSGLDLDAAGNFSAHDSPVVGQALCCSSGFGNWRGAPFWMSVERAGVNSHQPGPPWCPAGAYLLSVDLDGDRRYAPHDAPVVGQAQCAYREGAGNQWSECRWFGVGNSHQPEQWCAGGWFAVAYDLDGPRQYSPHDSPVVRQALCCRP